MLYERMYQRNPNLMRAAFELHREGVIPTATYVLDLDAIADNGRVLAEAARRHNLRVYAMTKQDGHNPYVGRILLDQGVDSIVAVEAIAANVLHRFGLPVGHVGHLSNIPQAQVARILTMDPEVVTVYSYDAAKAVSDAALAQHKTQRLYVRVNRAGDESFSGMVGGWPEQTCVEGIAPILGLPNVEVVGLTMHPVISYRNRDAYTAEPTDGFFTMLRAKERLERELGLRDLRVNCAANCNSATFATLARYGATDVEPGAAITGSSLFHVHQDLPERPAQVYVSEVSHFWEGDVYTYGGGLSFIHSVEEWTPRCVVGATFDEAHDRYMSFRLKGVIDYFGVCTIEGKLPRIGDTVVYALPLPQIFVNRSYVAAVSGISKDQPKLEGLFDSACNELDENFEPIPAPVTRARVERVAQSYVRAAGS
jgi:predicted amino acid racemase